MLGYIYFKDNKNAMPVSKSDVVKGSASLGMIAGQILFGLLGDAVGRHNVYGKELIVTIVGTLLCTLLPWRGLSHSGVIAWMSVFRVLTGLGIGGGKILVISGKDSANNSYPDYPMSSTLSAEKSAIGSRAKQVLLVFSNIGLGAFTSSIVYLILLAAFKGSIEQNVNHLEWVWRLLLGLGIIPCVLTLYGRLTMRETKPYQYC
jgi:MFS transporter, PHS family, inorganic phosphate transporter